MKMKMDIFSMFIYTLLFFSIIPIIYSKNVYRSEEETEDIFPLIDKEKLVVYRVATSIFNIANFLQNKMQILKKWYNLYQIDYYNQMEFSSFSQNDNNQNTDDNLNLKREKSNRIVSSIKKDHPQKVTIYQNLMNFKPLEDQKEEISSGQEKWKENEELNIHRYHYSRSNYIITNDGALNFFEETMDHSKKLKQDIFRRDTSKTITQCDEKLEYCETSCQTYKGSPLALDDSLAPMYNCSGRYLTNFYNKKKLPLMECSACPPKNITCLNWCCKLMDTSVNQGIPRNITVESKVNNTLVNTTILNPALKKVCYCPIDRYGPNCQFFYNVKCNLTLLTPTFDCYSDDGQKLKGLKFYDKSNHCPLYNYTDVITAKYNLLCYQELNEKFNLSLATNNYTFYSQSNYILNQLPLYISKSYIPISFTARLWNFNHMGSSNNIMLTLDNDQLVGNSTINVTIDLGKYYLPNDKMKSIFNGGRVVVEADFSIGHNLMGSRPTAVVSYINIGNYFKNMDFFEKEVILKTIKQVLSIIIPIVAGSLLLLAFFFFVIYFLYKKSRPMKVSC